MPIKTGGVINYNQKFIDTSEHFDTFISERVVKHPVIWFDRIPKGPLTMFAGLTQKTNIFHGGLGEQAGLSNWKQIQTSRVASGGDPGHDACNYAPKTFTYAWESKQYTGFAASWQSEPICINDIVYVEQGREQALLISSFLAYITQSVWENWNRENYIKVAVDAGNGHILTSGGLDYSDDPSVRFYYDPNVEDSDGNTYLLFDSSFEVSTLNWSYFDWWQDYLGDECSEAALTQKDQFSVFGLMIHKRDFQKAIMADADIREDLRYAQAQVLIDDYRTFSEWKGWALIHDSRQERYKYQKLEVNPTYAGESLTGTFVKAVRVTPRREGEAVTIGNLPEANPDYNNAELAIGVIFMNQVLQNLIPIPVSNLGNGMVFGAKPGFNGDFSWINEYDRELNPIKEVGYFFARFRAFPKPLMFSRNAIVFLYRRCPQTWATTCDLGPTDASTGAVAITSAEADIVVDTDDKTVIVTLAEAITAQVGDAVTLAGTSITNTSGYIAEGALAPTYTIAFAPTVTMDSAADFADSATVQTTA